MRSHPVVSQRAGTAGVTIMSPPRTPQFVDFHHESNVLAKQMKTHKGRNDIELAHNVLAPAPAPFQAAVPTQIIYVPHPYTNQRGLDTSSPKYQAHKKHVLSSLPIQEPAFHSVERWLDSLEFEIGAEKQDFPSMHQNLQCIVSLR